MKGLSSLLFLAVALCIPSLAFAQASPPVPNAPQSNSTPPIPEGLVPSAESPADVPTETPLSDEDVCVDGSCATASRERVVAWFPGKRVGGYIRNGGWFPGKRIGGFLLRGRCRGC